MYTVYGLVVLLLPLGADTDAKVAKCVWNYMEFETGTFVNNTENKYNLYKVFYQPYKHLPYSLKVTYESHFPNGSVKELSISPPCQQSKLMWLSATAFVIIRPQFLNQLSLYTLNYFEEWVSPNVTIVVPYPCLNRSDEFLLQMTTSLQDYAVGDTRKTHSGFVMRNCNNGRALYKIPNQYGYNEYHDKSTRLIHMIGIIFELILIWIGILYIMKSRSADYVQRTHFYTYKYYGLMCGCTCCSTATLPIMLYCVNTIADEIKPENELDLTYYAIGIGVDDFPALFGLVTAIYFAYKTKQTPAIPYILMMPVTVLFCCCNTKHAKSLAFRMALWINLMALQLLAFHGTSIAFAILAEPFAVITNTLVFHIVFCLINIFALIFTIVAYLFTPRNRRPPGEGATILRAVMLIPLLIMVGCFSFVIGSGGYIINVYSKEGSFRSLIGSVTIPLILGAVTFGMKTLISKCLERPGDVNPASEEYEDRDLEFEALTNADLQDDDMLNIRSVH